MASSSMAAAGEHSSHVPEVPQEPQLQDQQQQQQPQHHVDVGAPTLSLRAKRRLRKQQERADSKRQKTATISPPTTRATIPAEVAQITSESAAVQPDIAVSCSVCEWSLIEAATDDRVPSISIIIPVHNAEPWLDECLHSIATQRHRGRVQVSLYNDRSTDRSELVIERWRRAFEEHSISVVYRSNDGSNGRGCGFAKNRAIEQSSGEYLCFLDADDVMKPDRLSQQLALARTIEEPCIIGCHFERTPEGATPRYTEWHNSLTPEQRVWQQFREVTVAQPTWFMSRATFERVGAYDERFPNCPEDMIFYHQHLALGGKLAVVPEALLLYRHHPSATSKAISRGRLMEEKAQHFERQILESLPADARITIWNAGKDGRKFFMCLSREARASRVHGFCDVDPSKIGTPYYDHDNRLSLPVVHFREARPPVAICVGLDRSSAGEFDANLASMNWQEGRDYWHLC